MSTKSPSVSSPPPHTRGAPKSSWDRRDIGQKVDSVARAPERAARKRGVNATGYGQVSEKGRRGKLVGTN